MLVTENSMFNSIDDKNAELSVDAGVGLRLGVGVAFPLVGVGDEESIRLGVGDA